MPFGVAFGVTATEAGLAVWQTSAFSLLVFTGSAQFAAVTIIGNGGSVAAAVAAGLLLNLRSLAFGVVMAPALAGPRWRRAALSQLMIDETTAVGSAQASRAAQRYAYRFCGITLFVAWNVSTLVGAAGLSSAGDLVSSLGIDAAIPAAFLALLWPRLADHPQRRAALAGALLALALDPIAPPGIPVVASALGILAAWHSTPKPPARGGEAPDGRGAGAGRGGDRRDGRGGDDGQGDDGRGGGATDGRDTDHRGANGFEGQGTNAAERRGAGGGDGEPRRPVTWPEVG